MSILAAPLGSGKFQEKDRSTAFPSDNPFVNEPYMDGLGSRHEIYALGSAQSVAL